MSEIRTSRWVALTGPAFTLVFVLAGLILGNGEPGDGASTQEVVDFYSKNSGRLTASSLLAALGTFLLVLFASYFFAALREHHSPERVAPLVFYAGAILYGAGILVGSGVGLGLITVGRKKYLGGAQALNALSNAMWIPFIAGLAIMLIGGGWAICAAGCSRSGSAGSH